MCKARVYMHGRLAGLLMEDQPGGPTTFTYAEGYDGPPISRSMPVRIEPWPFATFPPVCDGWLPEGIMLEALLRERKIDRKDRFSQLMAVGADLVGAVTVEELI